MAPNRDQLVAYAHQAASRNGVNPNIFERLIDQESGFDPNAHNPSGADGIAQLMKSSYPNVDARNPYASLDAAAQTIGQNLKRYDGDYAKALAAYNAGGGAVDKYGGVPPFAETQRYVKTILGGGGTTMGQLQDSTPAPADAATNPGGSLSATAFSTLIDQHGGYVGMKQVDRMIPDPDFPTNRKMDTASPWPTLQFQLRDGKKLNAHFDPSTGGDGSWNVESGSTALATSQSSVTGGVSGASTNDQFISHRDPTTGQLIWEPNPNYVAPLPPRITSSAIGTGDQYIIQTDPSTGNITKVPNPNYVAPVNPKVTSSGGGPSDAFLAQTDPSTGAVTWVPNKNYVAQDAKYVDPNQTALIQAQTLEANARTAQTQADTQKTQQGLRPTAQAAIEDAYTSIDAIQAQLTSGQMTAAEANTLISQVHQGLSQTLTGVTLFEQQKQAQDTQTQRANTASSLLNQRVSSAASLGSSLFSAATANGGILMPAGKTTLGIDPMAIANQEVNQMGGGQATGDAASAFLQGAFGGGSSPASSGAPSPFPTTREAVLAMYPHLGQSQPGATPQPTNGPFIPPNLEQGAGGPGPMVIPPRPMSPTNQQIQAGG